MTDDCMGCRKPGQYSHAAYCPESRVEELRRDFEIEIEVNGVLRSRLAEAEALLREAIPAVQSYARKHGRAVVAAARRNDADHAAKHADIEKSAWGLADRIRAFLAPDSAPKRAYHETHEPPHCPTCECGADRIDTTCPVHGPLCLRRECVAEAERDSQAMATTLGRTQERLDEAMAGRTMLMADHQTEYWRERSMRFEALYVSLSARLAEYIKANAEVGSLNVELTARLAEAERQRDGLIRIIRGVHGTLLDDRISTVVRTPDSAAEQENDA